MADISTATIMCEKCNLKTEKGYIERDGFQIRTWNCLKCKNVWEHPADLQEFENFNKIKQKEFSVKLRLVGNSYAISIPKEIIEFHETMEKQFDDMVRLMFDGPDKLSLFFDERQNLFKKTVEKSSTFNQRTGGNVHEKTERRRIRIQ